MNLCYVGSIQNLKDLNDLNALNARRQPSPLEGWILEVIYCGPKGSRAVLWVLFTEGRGARLCWALLTPEGPEDTEGPPRVQAVPFHANCEMLTTFPNAPPSVWVNTLQQCWYSEGRS